MLERSYKELGAYYAACLFDKPKTHQYTWGYVTKAVFSKSEITEGFRHAHLFRSDLKGDQMYVENGSEEPEVASCPGHQKPCRKSLCHQPGLMPAQAVRASAPKPSGPETPRDTAGGPQCPGMAGWPSCFTGRRRVVRPS